MNEKEKNINIRDLENLEQIRETLKIGPPTKELFWNIINRAKEIDENSVKIHCTKESLCFDFVKRTDYGYLIGSNSGKIIIILPENNYMLSV